MSPRLRFSYRTLPFEVPGSLAVRLFSSSFGGDATPALTWLDSSSGPLRGDDGRFSILCNSDGPGAREFVYRGEGGFFDELASGLGADAGMELPEGWPCEFALGWVGAFGYELRHDVEPGLEAAPGLEAEAGQAPPRAALIYTTRALVIEHGVGLHLLTVVDESHPDSLAHADAQQHWVNWMQDELTRLQKRAPHQLQAPFDQATFTFRDSRQQYLANIQRCLEYIAAGDSYEVCLTNTATGPALTEVFTPLQSGRAQQQELTPEMSAYLRLREVSPVPYGCFARFPSAGASGKDLHIVSASPERFLRLAASGEVTAKPIKGTRDGRGVASPEKEREIARELAGNPKDRAENLMIVDLLRNDLGRVCAPGSVEVPRIFDVERYSHVFQLVSTVSGRLREGLAGRGAGAVELLRACFPGGSMTGAPKLRTMEIIEELEGTPRGFYSGAVGWMSATGAADLNIVIRTLVDDSARCSFGVGGAIVADSDPAAEWEEIVVKASALVEALGARVEE
ncbi:MAG TPA: anthranilate synthase component I family protein [Candidatus Corynebacterium gallistercoris]|uniref:Anthranilate synthase component I family protein n=1 Tax=Candidatus Corynebacterium gallistercoris TaxID=2838530 RepID=A0A9D1S0I9_9CORY|nr:anthranilate synthase component I family protein [Candidatus Corynebacterium gallistercoris]